jgi:fructokinase
MIAGVETGGTKVICGVVDPAFPSQLLETARFATTTPTETVAHIAEFLRDADERLGIDAIGIATFGPVNVQPELPRYGWIMGTGKPGWANTNLLDRLGTAAHVPTIVLSDVSGAALGEQRWGAARDVPSSAYATFGTGVGVGIVVNGRVFHGDGYPEFGHLLVRRHPLDDYEGHCPFHGDCLEGLAAGPAVMARWGADSSHLDPCTRQQAHEILGFYIAQTEGGRAAGRGTTSALERYGRPDGRACHQHRSGRFHRGPATRRSLGRPRSRVGGAVDARGGCSYVVVVRRSRRSRDSWISSLAASNVRF